MNSEWRKLTRANHVSKKALGDLTESEATQHKGEKKIKLENDFDLNLDPVSNIYTWLDTLTLWDRVYSSNMGVVITFALRL